jgi:PiT family inorganic phosphate transporter
MAGWFQAIHTNVILKIASFILLAPVIWMVIAFIIAVLVAYICRKASPYRAKLWFKKLQLLSSALFSIGHWLNDSQKVMWIIAAAMIAASQIPSIEKLPTWIPFACFGAISLWTMSGWWKIVKTMWTRITKVSPQEWFIAETAGALTLYLTEWLKVPVSTTHTITGAIVWVGVTKRLSAVRWWITKKLLWAWILTIPISAILAAGIYYLFAVFWAWGVSL